jgi:hypothetical protein
MWKFRSTDRAVIAQRYRFPRPKFATCFTALKIYASREAALTMREASLFQKALWKQILALH